MEVSYSPTFVRMLRGLPKELQEEVLEKIEAFRDTTNHKSLKVHKLSGRLEGRYSFSVDYKTRIVFLYLPIKPRQAYFLAVGDHDIYQR